MLFNNLEDLNIHFDDLIQEFCTNDFCDAEEQIEGINNLEQQRSKAIKALNTQQNIAQETPQEVPVAQPVVEETPTTNAQKVSDVMSAIMSQVVGDIEKGVIEEEVTQLESMAFDVMSFIGSNKSLLAKVLNAKPEEVYGLAYKAVKVLNMKLKVDKALDSLKAKKAIAVFEQVEGVEVKLLDKVKAVFTVLLIHTGRIIANTLGLVIDVTAILSIYIARVAGHVCTETFWACREICLSFNKRMIKPYVKSNQ